MTFFIFVVAFLYGGVIFMDTKEKNKLKLNLVLSIIKYKKRGVKRNATILRVPEDLDAMIDKKIEAMNEELPNFYKFGADTFKGKTFMKQDLFLAFIADGFGCYIDEQGDWKDSGEGQLSTYIRWNKGAVRKELEKKEEDASK